MSYPLNLKKYIFLAIFFFLKEAMALSVPVKGNVFRYFDVYDSLSKEFVSSHCSSQNKEHYSSLLKRYKSFLYFFPILSYENGKDTIDWDAIDEGLKELDKKILWVTFFQSYNTSLWEEEKKRMMSFIQIVEDSVDHLMDAKRKFFLDAKKRKEAMNESKKWKEVLKNAFFEAKTVNKSLTTYDFPVNYEDLRRDYEWKKKDRSLSGQKKKNSIYVKRKLMEDGLMSLSDTKGDENIRAIWNMLFLQVQLPYSILSEDLRHDLKYFSSQVKKFYEQPFSSVQKKYKEWLDRLQNNKTFYVSLKDKKTSESELKKFLDERQNILSFILEEHLKTILYWSKQEEVYQAFFVLDTILFNEIGSLPDPGGSDKREIIQVVINRTKKEKYREFAPHEDLVRFAHQRMSPAQWKQLTKSPWIKTLLKEGEFSFTYFFIPQVMNIVCMPQRTEYSALQKENLKWIVGLLESPMSSFKGVKYFSRDSMFGRVHMAPIWKDVKAIREEEGDPVSPSMQKEYKQMMEKGQWEFLYRFYNRKNLPRDVYQSHSKKVVVSHNPLRFYYYRSPHRFRFFQ